MAVTLIYDDRTTNVPSASADGDELWMSLDDLTAATGWERKPQGLCLGEVCVPIPPGREAEFAVAERFNFAAFARYLDRPVVHDDAASVWVVGASPGQRAGALRSLDAPDFRLPDLDGTMHALSDHRGKKVLLLSWASW